MGARTTEGQQVPVQLASSYFPLDIAGGTAIEQADTGPGGSKSRLADLGHAQVSITETIEVRTPEPGEAAALDMDEDQRLYQVTHVGRTADGRAVEVAIHLMPTHLWALSYTWDLDPAH
jgi:GntR family transcriptional regulator